MVLEDRSKQVPVNRMNIKVSISERFSRCTTSSAREDCAMGLESSPGVTGFGSDPTVKLYTLPSGEWEKYIVPSYTIAEPPPYSCTLVAAFQLAPKASALEIVSTMTARPPSDDLLSMWYIMRDTGSISTSTSGILYQHVSATMVRHLTGKWTSEYLRSELMHLQ